MKKNNPETFDEFKKELAFYVQKAKEKHKYHLIKAYAEYEKICAASISFSSFSQYSRTMAWQNDTVLQAYKRLNMLPKTKGMVERRPKKEKELV
jgi:cytochrome c1